MSRTVLALTAGAVLALTVSVTPTVAAPAGPPEQPSAPIATQLKERVAEAKSGERITALVMLDNPGQLRGPHHKVVGDLKRHAAGSQRDVEAQLERHPRTAGDVTVLNRFWLTNMLLVEFTADNQRLAAMAGMRGVRRVIPNFEVTAPEPVASTSPGILNGEITWGLGRIGADRVWDELGVDGSGVLVATLDTGVDITHPDLAGKMVTDDPSDPQYPGGWMEFNSSGNLVPSQPRDSAYHGTHVSGTIHGDDTSGVAIGVAPGAEMMHGLVIPGGSGSFAQVAAGMQWAVAPTDADGNPAGRPADVVNMSLGGNGFHEEMIPPTRAMRAAGIFPAFAIGNNCGSAGTASPGNVFDAVGVGATDDAENVAGFSCGGVIDKSRWSNPPADWPDSYVKPDISAPGVDVWSASPGGGYRTLSGTSMATPHTAGTVALMRSAAPELTVESVLDGLIDTGFWEDRYADAPPDTRYGAGRINAYEATAQVAIDSGVTGTVTDAGTGDPIEGATVSVNPGARVATTGEDGRFTVRVEPGAYSVQVEAFGYTSTSKNVQVTAETFTTVDTALTPGPRGDISGTVTLDKSGEGIPGVTVSVLGTPVAFEATTGNDGTYIIRNVPAGTYSLAASHPRFVAPPTTDVTVTVTDGGTAQANFAFGAPPRSVALVGSYVTKFRDEVFAPRGIETVTYGWDELVEAAQHSTVVLGYGSTSNYNAERFQAFLDATDANGTGVIFTHHAFGTGTGIWQLSRHTGQPESTGQNSGGSGSAESFYTVTADHPIFAGYRPGDRIVLDNSTQAKWIGWFDNYAGDARQTIATVGRSGDSIGGGGIGVDQRATNRHVLLASHGVSVTRGPENWTPEATQLFLNAINWASPPPDGDQPYFAVHNLRVEPDVVKTGTAVTVRAEVKNVGSADGSYDAVLRVDGQPDQTSSVALARGQSATMEWTVNRADLGSYSVELEYLRDDFRVRAPIVDLTALSAGAPDATTTAGPLAGATVELIDSGRVVGVGTTDARGKRAFEIPDVAGAYQIVVRRGHVNSGDDAYLLHRTVTVNDDLSVTFAPQVGVTGADGVVRANLRLDQVNADHTAQVFVRPATTTPYGFGFQPGTLIATLDSYEAVPVHRVNLQEQDWWLPGRIVGGIAWNEPADQLFAFGGTAKAGIGEVTVDADGKATMPWGVTDAHGRSFATVLSGDVRPFADLPDVVQLEQIVSLVRAKATNEQLPILRLFDPTGEQVRAGSIPWGAQPYGFSMPADALGGEYQLRLEAGIGGYGEPATATGAMQLGDVRLSTTRPEQAVAKSTWEYRVVANNSGAAVGPLTWTVRVGHAGGALTAADVVLRLHSDDRWQRIDLTAAEDGTLVGTVAEGVNLAPGEQSWRLSLQFRGALGEYTVVDRFSGEGVAFAHVDRVASVADIGSRDTHVDKLLIGAGA